MLFLSTPEENQKSDSEGVDVLFSPGEKQKCNSQGAGFLFTVLLEDFFLFDSEGADVLFKAPLEENQMCDCNSM